MDSGKLYIVMEYADGGDLSQRVTALKAARGSFMSEDEALNLFVQICLALKHMHDRRILHRDLKCQNVWLGHKGRGRRITMSPLTLTTSRTPFAHLAGIPNQGWYRKGELLVKFNVGFRTPYI